MKQRKNKAKKIKFFDCMIRPRNILFLVTQAQKNSPLSPKQQKQLQNYNNIMSEWKETSI